jgi:hypothetical protein
MIKELMVLLEQWYPAQAHYKVRDQQAQSAC